MPLMGSVYLVAFNFAPTTWMECDGRVLQISQYTALFSIIGAHFGGDGSTTFALPDLRGRAPIHVDSNNTLGDRGGQETVGLDILQTPSHTHALMASTGSADLSSASGNLLATGSSRGIAVYVLLAGHAQVDMDEHAIENTGGGADHANIQPYLALKYVICVDGTYPPHGDTAASVEGAAVGDAVAAPAETDPLLGEVRIYPYPFAPKNWAQCNGQLLPIATNKALYSLLGTTYGGNGQTTFALPDLRGRVPVGMGQGQGLSPYALGQKGGAEQVSLQTAEIPSHFHQAELAEAAATTTAPSGNMLANAANVFSSGNFDVTLNPRSIANCNGGQGHENMMPFLTLNYCICVNGIFPSRGESRDG